MYRIRKGLIVTAMAVAGLCMPISTAVQAKGTAGTRRTDDRIAQRTASEREMEKRYMAWRIPAYERVSAHAKETGSRKELMILMEIDLAVVAYITAGNHASTVSASRRVAAAYERNKKFFGGKKAANEYAVMQILMLAF